MYNKYITIGKFIDKRFFCDSMHSYGINKPVGGLWASPYTPNEKYLSSWHEFEINEMSVVNSIASTFNLKENSKVYTINTLDDLLNLPTIKKHDFYKSSELDFEEIRKQYDAIFLSEQGQWETRFSSPISLYGWDVECILILNYDCIDEKSIQFIGI